MSLGGGGGGGSAFTGGIVAQATLFFFFAQVQAKAEAPAMTGRPLSMVPSKRVQQKPLNLTLTLILTLMGSPKGPSRSPPSLHRRRR